MDRKVMPMVLAIVVAIAVVAGIVFTSVNQAPDAGTGATQQDNISAGVPEARTDAVGEGQTSQPAPASR